MIPNSQHVALKPHGLNKPSASSNILLQTLSEERKRGRVMSLYAMAVSGMMPLGGLTVGASASPFGLTPTLLTGGLLCLAGAARFAWVLSRTDAFEVSPPLQAFHV